MRSMIDFDCAGNFGMVIIVKALSWIWVYYWKSMDLAMGISSERKDCRASAVKSKPLLIALERAQAGSGLLWARSNIKS